MRKTGPVTQREVLFSRDKQLITSTNPKGVITFCNESFCEAAGYTEAQLLGQAHNVIRHPDMPPAAFAKMWQDLKAGKHWMGLVKNRCANGDHYWVDAYVTPVRNQGEITGFESVRIAPTQTQKNRAEHAYKRMRAGKNAVPLWLRIWSRYNSQILVTLLLVVLGSSGLVLSGSATPLHILVEVIIASACGLIVSMIARSGNKTSLEEARKIINDPLASYIYTGRCDTSGEIIFAQLAQQARLRTALGRFLESSRTLVDKSTLTEAMVNKTKAQATEQQRESRQVAESMTQMTQAIQEIASSVSATSNASLESLEQVKQGGEVINTSKLEIGALRQTVEELDGVLAELSTGSEKISSVTSVIGSIAEQTNLLALNAAIEAARAGDQGRGFSVVADEVRSLAQRTQESTRDIQTTIEELGKATRKAVDNMQSCRERSDRSVQSVEEINNSLHSISESVVSIERMTQQIASASEEQSSVSVEVSQNAQTISKIAEQTEDQSEQACDVSHQMHELAQAQLRLIERFK